MNISAVVAVSENNVIGYKGNLPWHLPDDLKYFRQTTTKHSVLMGRKTFENIGKPLPNRYNLILSVNYELDTSFRNCYLVGSIGQAIAKAESLQSTDLFLIGGQQLFEVGLPYITKLFLTRVHAIVPGDTFFPWNHLFGTWKETFRQFRSKDIDNAFDRTIYIFERTSI